MFRAPVIVKVIFVLAIKTTLPVLKFVYIECTAGDISITIVATPVKLISSVFPGAPAPPAPPLTKDQLKGDDHVPFDGPTQNLFVAEAMLLNRIKDNSNA